MTSVLQLGVGVVLLFTVVVVVVPAASQDSCRGVPHENFGCQTYTLTSRDAGKCLFMYPYFPDFYLRPSPTFTNLQIKITWSQGSPTPINIGRNVLKQPNKWYHLQMMSDPHFDALYKVYIDGQEWGSVRKEYRAHTFDVYVTGSLHYAVNCNPSHYQPPTPPPLQPSPTRSPPPQTEPSPPTASPPDKSTEDDINPPTTVTVSPQVHSTSSSVTENGQDAEEHSTMDDSGKSEDDMYSETIHQCLGLSWYIWVIIGAIVDVMVDVIAIAALVIMMKKVTKEKQRTRQSQVTSLGRIPAKHTPKLRRWYNVRTRFSTS